jgi:hypothetical protein
MVPELPITIAKAMRSWGKTCRPGHFRGRTQWNLGTNSAFSDTNLEVLEERYLT